MQDLISILKNHQANFSPIVVKEFFVEQPYVFDFTEKNLGLSKINIGDLEEFTNYVEQALKKANKKIGVGGYGEDRIMYKMSPLFTPKGEEARSVHLAVDLWLPSGNAIFSPLAGQVHSFQDNSKYLDYGPTIILEHELEDIKFYTLYGHLSRKSLSSLLVGQVIKAGEQIASLGSSDENGGYPAHLHFQIISDMLGKVGDFPGVCKPSEKDYYLSLCPNPNLILQIPNLPWSIFF